MMPLLKLYHSTPIIAYGIGPVISAAFGFLFSWIICSCLQQTGMSTIEKDGILYSFLYSSKGGGTKQYKQSEQRRLEINKTESKVSWSSQLRTSLWTVLGPGALFNACLSAMLLPNLFIISLPNLPLYPTFINFIITFSLCHVIGDLGLYLGHRLQHENKYLWTHYHSKHHEIETPTTVSTAYIHPVDMTLQASLPMLFAVVLVQAHPITFA